MVANKAGSSNAGSINASLNAAAEPEAVWALVLGLKEPVAESVRSPESVEIPVGGISNRGKEWAGWVVALVG